MALVAHGELLNDSPRARTAHGLRQCILEGLFLTGDRLPAEQKLALTRTDDGRFSFSVKGSI